MVNMREPRTPGRLKVFFLAGEASGDAYGAELIRCLKAQCEDRGWTLDAVGWGGDRMEAEGMRLLTHLNQTSFMGFWEVATHLRTILRNLQRAREDVVRETPDVVLTIDFPGFNLRLAEALRKRDDAALRVQWVAPQVWAWKAGRSAKLARDFHAVAPILPFEQPLLKRANVNVWECGHPLLDLLPAHVAAGRPVSLALLPGSRAQELKHHLEPTIQAAVQGAARGLWKLEDVVVAGAPGRTLGDYAVATEAGLKVVFGQTHELLLRAQRAWVASGTATLEAALLDTPHVVLYRTSTITFQLAKSLAKVEFIGLPNLLLGRRCVPELIQRDLTPEALLKLTQGDLEGQRQGFAELREALGGSGASARLAEKLLGAFA
jgi:lipid-A-disaccharide synthase